MSIKNSLVLEHIKKLEPGSKISVRGLATALNISEGTVYKAIKEAETQGLVLTKAKSGTFRMDTRLGSTVEGLTLTSLTRMLGFRF